MKFFPTLLQYIINKRPAETNEREYNLKPIFNGKRDNKPSR